MRIRSDIRSLFVLAGATLVTQVVISGFPVPKVSKKKAALEAPLITFNGSGRISITGGEDESLRFSTDGSLPSLRSLAYRGTFDVDDAQRTASLIATPTGVQWRHPVGAFPRAITVRAAFVDIKGRRGEVATRSFVPLSDTLPVIAITLPPGAFFDPDSGIYVLGNAIFRTSEGSVRAFPNDRKWWKYPGNFHMRGRKWARQAHLEYFAPSPSALSGVATWSADMHLRINGNNTRGFAQHALRMEFDQKVEQPVFGQEEGAGFKSLLLRSSGNDQDRTFFRDQFQHGLCKVLPFETVAGAQCIVYVDGAYWGIHNLRERMDEKELARRYHIPAKRITILADRLEVYRGDPEDRKRFERLIDGSERWNADGPSFVDSLERYMDVDGFLNYMAAQIILGNTDWPDQNGKWWRYTGEPDTTRPKCDGRWYWIMGDSDLSFGLVSGPDYDMFGHVERRNTPLARIYKACLRSPFLRERFRTIVKDLLNGPLSAGRMVRLAEQERDRVAGEMERHVRRWRRPLTCSVWQEHVHVLLNFARKRPQAVLNQLDTHVHAALR